MLLAAACFSARFVTYSWRLWMAASIAVIMSRLVGSCLSAPLIRASAASGSSMVRFTMWPYPSLMMWLGLAGCCCCWAAALAAARYSVGEEILSGKRAAIAAPPAAARLVDKERGGRFILPIREAVFDLGTGVGLLA